MERGTLRYFRRRFRAEIILRFHTVASRQTKTPVQQSSAQKEIARKWRVLPPPALFRALAAVLVPIVCAKSKGKLPPSR